MTIADQLRAEGLHKGRQEGRQEGAQDALAKAVVTALEVRFGQVPGDLVFAVKEIPEVARLEDVLRAALSSASLEDFRHRI
jgi:predicted transposase YdaD